MTWCWHRDGVATDEALVMLERARTRRLWRVADESRPFADGTAFRRARSSWANILLGAGMSDAAGDVDLPGLVAWYAEVGAEPRVELSDRARTPFVDALRAHGFGVLAVILLLARDVRPGDAALDPGAPEGIRIERLDPADTRRCEAMARVLVSAFTPDGQPVRDDDVTVNLTGLVHPGQVTFVALAGDHPVGGGMVDIDGHAATLYGGAVDRAWRRRGVQTALLRARVRWAAEAGARVVGTGTVSGGPTHRNGAREGFGIIGSRIVLARSAAPATGRP